MCVLLAAVGIGLQIGIQFVTNCKYVDVNIGSSFYLTGVVSHFLQLMQFGVSWCSYIVVQCIAFKMFFFIFFLFSPSSTLFSSSSSLSSSCSFSFFSFSSSSSHRSYSLKFSVHIVLPVQNVWPAHFELNIFHSLWFILTIHRAFHCVLYCIESYFIDWSKESS